MDMDPCEPSEVARPVWVTAHQHFLNNYGLSIIDVVKNNPKGMTVHFCAHASNWIVCCPIHPTNIDLDEKGQFRRHEIQGSDCRQESPFAGHTLGEYSALTSLVDVMPIETLADVVFYRGMTMSVAVPRGAAGPSNRGMVDISPSRVSSAFDDTALRFVVENIAQSTEWLLVIVNYSVENRQYAAAGDLPALGTFTNVLSFLMVQNISTLASCWPPWTLKRSRNICTKLSMKLSQNAWPSNNQSTLKEATLSSR
ncbi:hypothetical protein TRICI_003964 [Trichomonascus ciferrii]|uniref:Malonyl-CoA:ACP transacylase (MAT) domain-containing protein n=1 Tax=Trichomonascus ciferrii TaxID=44093 RepID=A0A642V1L2_9ASCO|nr:hypothetical protein TRICI_003964 [Trichomonascus ciferrii]